MAGVAAGFSWVFGTPVTATLFAMEAMGGSLCSRKRKNHLP
jgi:H+/Cl- antiporter ClcA